MHVGIPDNYRFNDPALIELLKQKVQPYLPMEAKLQLNNAFNLDKKRSSKKKIKLGVFLYLKFYVFYKKSRLGFAIGYFF